MKNTFIQTLRIISYVLVPILVGAITTNLIRLKVPGSGATYADFWTGLILLAVPVSVIMLSHVTAAKSIYGDKKLGLPTIVRILKNLAIVGLLVVVGLFPFLVYFVIFDILMRSG